LLLPVLIAGVGGCGGGGGSSPAVSSPATPPPPIALPDPLAYDALGSGRLCFERFPVAREVESSSSTRARDGPGALPDWARSLRSPPTGLGSRTRPSPISWPPGTSTRSRRTEAFRRGRGAPSLDPHGRRL